MEKAEVKITGRGVLGWPGTERRTDRYGLVTLSLEGYEGNGKLLDASWTTNPTAVEGYACHVVAKVIEARESSHIGDLFRGIFPTTPHVGEIIDLGVGHLFTEPADWAIGKIGIGLKPSDGRDRDWFDPKKLYRLHDQTVELTIAPAGVNANG